MNVYLYSGMRIQDENKKEAIFKATVKLVNNTGFAASSVSKIAKEADVSPATIYIYYKNKEDLLISTYVEIKRYMGEELLKGIDSKQPLRDICFQLWTNLFDFIANNKGIFLYTEQFANSPYSDLVDKEKVEEYFEPMFAFFERGIKEKIIKDVNKEILVAFCFYPASYLSNTRLCLGFERTDKNIETAFDLCWDAIKL